MAFGARQVRVRVMPIPTRAFFLRQPVSILQIAAMNHGICTFRVWFFLLLLSFAGCATQQSVAPDRHLEKYRTVYLLKNKTDPRNVNDRVAKRLRNLGFDVTDIPCDDTTKSGRSEAIKKARQLASASNGQSAVLCCVSSLSLYEETEITNSRRYYFETLGIQFYDIKSGDLVFKTAKYNYDNLMPEELELNRQLAKISDAFFSGKPNAFLAK